jgi:hypothetical protein
MRPGKLFTALLAVTPLLALAPASTSALKHPNPHGRCRIDINVAPREITADDPVVIFGRLLCRRAANQTVQLYHRLRRGGGFRFTYVQSTTTDAHGFYEFSRADGVVETNRVWYVRSHSAQSGRKGIRVAAQVTLTGPEAKQLVAGTPQRFTGTVNPADVGAPVILQRQNAVAGNDEWQRIGVGAVEAGGNYAITHTFAAPGDANVRVLVRSHGRNVPNSSEVLDYQISQAQKSQLTIEASADPIAYGQSVTFSGALTGPLPPFCVVSPDSQCPTPDGHWPLFLYLYAHGVPPAFFTAPYGQSLMTTANGSGDYTFPAQTPTNSTFYEITGPCLPPCVEQIGAPGALGMVSATLYEGVEDVLTAQASATTIRAGRTLTFSGTVAPDHTGHPIYLERQNRSGTGYHVVEVSTVAGGSAYSIPHAVYDTGSQVYRVSIPGGPENGGANSQPFTIDVTPAPAASLKPEPPTNSTQPAQGQF